MIEHLMKERLRLTRMTEIPSMAQYSKDWYLLGEKFDAEGYKNNAAICFSNAKRYAVDGNVTVRVEGTTIRFPSADAMAGWLAERMQE
jgi:hypothetical protein